MYWGLYGTHPQKWEIFTGFDVLHYLFDDFGEIILVITLVIVRDLGGSLV